MVGEKIRKTTISAASSHKERMILGDYFFAAPGIYFCRTAN